MMQRLESWRTHRTRSGRGILAALTLASTLGIAAAPAAAQDQGDNPDSAMQQAIQQQLSEMQRELQQLRQENAEMRLEVDELRSASDENWMTEQRAEEIKQIVNDVLVDSDTRASLLQNGMTAGWHEHFFLASPDGRFKLVLEGTIQTRFIYGYSSSQGDSHRSGFENTRTTMTFRGHVFDRGLQYLVRTDFTRNEPGLVTGLNFLRDAWIRKDLSDTWSVRFGQFKLPFNREELMPATRILTIERSLVNESLNIGRSQGIEIMWVNGPHKWSLAISDGGADEIGGFAGIIAGGSTSGPTGGSVELVNPNNSPALVEDVEYSFTTRYEQLVAGTWDQFADFTSPVDQQFAMMWGVAVHIQEGEGNAGAPPNRDRRFWTAYTADLSIEWGGANLYAAWVHHYIDNPRNALGVFNFMGAVVQGGVYITPKWEVFARGEYGHIRTDSISVSSSDAQDLYVFTVGANYYMDGHDAKFSCDLGIGINEVSRFWDAEIAGFRPETSGTAPQIVFRTQFQLLF